MKKSDKIHKYGKFKTGLFCPAKIIVKENLSKKTVKVQYIFPHNDKVSIANKKFQSMPQTIKKRYQK